MMCRIFSNHKGQTARTRKKNPYSFCSPCCSLFGEHIHRTPVMNCSRPATVHSTLNARGRKRERMQSSSNNNHHWIQVFSLPYPSPDKHNIGHGTQHKCGSISTGERDHTHTHQERRMKHTKSIIKLLLFQIFKRNLSNVYSNPSDW